MKDKLITEGYLEFNLKDTHPTLYQKLKETFPTEQSMIDMIHVWRVSKHLEIPIEEFVEKYKSDFPNWDSTEDKKTYANRLIQAAQHPKHLGGMFYGDYDSLIKVKDYVDNQFEGNKTDSWLTAFDMENKIPFTRELMKSIIDTFYDSNSYDINQQGINLSCYSKNDWLQKHTDDDSQNRVCVVLIYLNHTWESKNGGQLMVGDVSIEPEFGKVVILDNTYSSLEHEVIKVTNGNRFAINSFVLTKEGF